MEDGESFVAGRMQTRGAGGTVEWGHRTVTTLQRWTADVATNEDGSRLQMRLSVQQHEPDDYWLDNCPDEVLLKVKFGRKQMEGDAQLLNRDPLIIQAVVSEVEQPEEDEEEPEQENERGSYY